MLSTGRLHAISLLLCLAGSAAAQVTLTEGTNFSVHAARDGRLVIDLLGGIWIVPETGGTAEPVAAGLSPSRRPRWSPTADSIVYQAHTGSRDQLRLYDFDLDAAEDISDGRFVDQHPNWHPDGERIVFSSARRGSGFDLWELDLATRLVWRLTSDPGDESEPAWSANGRDLIFVHHEGDQWSLVLRRHGQPDHDVVTSSVRLSAPEWRPDGSLVTFLRHATDGLSIDMAILAEPPLIRPMIIDEDLFDAPVTWIDRQQLVYTANGVIRRRNFNSWTSTTLPFRVLVNRDGLREKPPLPARDLPLIDTPDGELVLRAARLFDGIGGGYRDGLDILIANGRIAAVEAQRDRPGSIIVDMGDLTALPGFADAYAALPPNADAALGPLLLSFGVTTVIADHEQAEALNEIWSGKDMPGPRVLRARDIGSSDNDAVWLVTIAGDLASGVSRRSDVSDRLNAGIPVLAANWQVGLGSGATMLLGAESLPASPSGRRYSDIEFSNGAAPVTIVSGLADARTPGLETLLRSRQAELLDQKPVPSRRFGHAPGLGKSGTSVVLGSQPNGLPPGIAQHAEFNALAAAGLTGEQILRAAGVNVASALGLGLQLGRIAPGSVADIVLVDGDPLQHVGDIQKVVGVVRNGRFYSAIGLIERARNARNVE